MYEIDSKFEIDTNFTVDIGADIFGSISVTRQLNLLGKFVYWKLINYTTRDNKKKHSNEVLAYQDSNSKLVNLYHLRELSIKYLIKIEFHKTYVLSTAEWNT